VIDEAALLLLHVDVLFSRDADGRLLAGNEPDGERAPRLFLARGRSSFQIAFRDDVPAAAVSRLTEVARGCRAGMVGHPIRRFSMSSAPPSPSMRRSPKSRAARHSGSVGVSRARPM
jgi:hypothetical protein